MPPSFIESSFTTRAEYDAWIKSGAAAQVDTASDGAKDVIIVIPTNNPGKILLFAALNPKLAERVDFKGPSDFGGFASPEYKKINPQGLYPACICSDGTQLFESTVIVRYLQDKYASLLSESFVGATVAERTKANLIISIHDQYISGVNCTQPNFYSNQAIVYKPDMPLEERKARFADIKKQFDTLEGLLDAAGPYAAGPTLSLADVCLYPTVAILGAFGDASILGANPIAGKPKLSAWFAKCDAQPAFKGVSEKMFKFCGKWPMPAQIKASFK